MRRDQGQEAAHSRRYARPVDSCHRSCCSHSGSRRRHVRDGYHVRLVSVPDETLRRWRLSRPAVSPRRCKGNVTGECGDRQALRSRKRICCPSEAVGRRTNVRMAWSVQASRQRLGESQSQGARISAPRFNPAHAEKAMQSSMISPDRLLGSLLGILGHKWNR